MNPTLLLSSILCSTYIIHHTITRAHNHPIITPITLIGAMTSIANHGTNIAAFQLADRVWISLSAAIYLYYIYSPFPRTSARECDNSHKRYNTGVYPWRIDDYIRKHAPHRKHIEPIYWLSVALFVASKTIAPTPTIQIILHASTHFNTTYLYLCIVYSRVFYVYSPFLLPV
jgi:hypothetical protein